MIAGSVSDRRLTVTLLAVFGAAATLLAAIGLYGVIAYAVGQRTRGFGIRVALGATKGDVLGLVLRRGLMLTGIGIAAGVAGSLALKGLLTRYLFEVKPTDSATMTSRLR